MYDRRKSSEKFRKNAHKRNKRTKAQKRKRIGIDGKERKRKGKIIGKKKERRRND